MVPPADPYIYTVHISDIGVGGKNYHLTQHEELNRAEAYHKPNGASDSTVFSYLETWSHKGKDSTSLKRPFFFLLLL